MNLEGVMSLYAPDIVSLTLYRRRGGVVGSKGKKRKTGRTLSPTNQRPLGNEILVHLTLTLGDDVAFGHSLNRVSGTLKNGNTTDFWLRWTACLCKDRWQLAHRARPGLSACRSGMSGRALLNLEP